MRERRVIAGQRFGIEANEFNAWQAAADRVLGNANPVPQVEVPSTFENTILVKNNSGTDSVIFSILGISGFLISPTDNPNEFKNRGALVGIAPITLAAAGTGETPTEDSFVILAEPIKAGSVGRAYVTGACPVQISVTSASHQYARIIDDDKAKLESSEKGPVVILWKESGTGLKWAIVRWGGSSAGSGTRMRVKSVQSNYLTCRSWDGTTEGTSDVYVAKPYTLRASLVTFDGSNFSGYSTDGQTKIASSGSTVEAWEITPKWISNCEIVVQSSPAGGTGVVGPGSVALVLFDANVDGRQWAKVPDSTTADGGIAGSGTEWIVAFTEWIVAFGELSGSGAEAVADGFIPGGALKGGTPELEGAGIVGVVGFGSLSGAASQIELNGTSGVLGSHSLGGPGGQLACAGIAHIQAQVALEGGGAVIVGWAA